MTPEDLETIARLLPPAVLGRLMALLLRSAVGPPPEDPARAISEKRRLAGLAGARARLSKQPSKKEANAKQNPKQNGSKTEAKPGTDPAAIAPAVSEIDLLFLQGSPADQAEEQKEEIKKETPKPPLDTAKQNASKQPSKTASKTKQANLLDVGPEEQGDHQRLVDAYFAAFEAANGAKPAMVALDWKALKTLRESVGIDTALLVVANAHGDSWGKSQGIQVIAKNPSRWLGSSKKPDPASADGHIPKNPPPPDGWRPDWMPKIPDHLKRPGE